PLLQHAGATVSAPLRGLTQGQHLAWYDTPRARSAEDDNVHASIEAALDNAITTLKGDTPRSAATFPWGRTDLDQPGLYAWWVDREGAAQLGFPVPNCDVTLAYMGQAGATKWPSEMRSSATLLSRIKSQHLGGTIS